MLLLSAAAPTLAHAHDSGGSTVGIARGNAGLLVAGEELGFHGDFLIAGPSEFTFGVDTTVVRQKTASYEETFNESRIYIGFSIVEFFSGWNLNVQLGLAFGEKLIGGQGYADFGAGVEFQAPLFLDEEGHPYWVFLAAWKFSFEHFNNDWQVQLLMSVNPLPEPVRELGLWGGWLFGDSGNVPWGAVFIGIGWTGHVH